MIVACPILQTADCPNDEVKCHVVPYPFSYWPSNLTKDPSVTIEDLFGDASTGVTDSMSMATIYIAKIFTYITK